METPPLHVLLALDAQILGVEVYDNTSPTPSVTAGDDRSTSSTTGHDDDEAAATPSTRPLPKPSSGGRPGWIGAYSPEARKRRIARFHGKRARRVWTKRVRYDVRKDFASTRPRVEGRFAKKEEEDLLKLIGALDGAISPRTI